MSTFIIGDLHGYHEQYIRLLRETGLCDSELNWTGGRHHLWLIGDFFDRGVSGIKCVDITMKLQQQACLEGGYVQSLLGNHEMMILCAYHFRNESNSDGVRVVDKWLNWGGKEQDLEEFTPQHARWIEALPAMARVGQALLLHADAMLYINFGTTVDMVNNAFTELMANRDLQQWELTLSAFAEHMAFSELEMTGKQRASQVLRLYGGEILIHGHTPIPFARRLDPGSVIEAWTYGGGTCINIDGGIYMGGPGFVYELPDAD
jgi:Calcineurin-like phosphoesterase